MSGRFIPDAGRSAMDLNQNAGEGRPGQRGRPGSPRREPGYGGGMAGRFDAPDRNVNRSPPPAVHRSPHDNPAAQFACRAQLYGPSGSKPAPDQQPRHTRKNAPTNPMANASMNDRRPPRPRTPNADAVERASSAADVVPQSPSPPSPPPAPPSAYALAVSRMVEMEADMQFAYARLMMLDHEHKKIEARLSTIEKLTEEGNGDM